LIVYSVAQWVREILVDVIEVIGCSKGIPQIQDIRRKGGLTGKINKRLKNYEGETIMRCVNNY